jgi:hypothetical protein
VTGASRFLIGLVTCFATQDGIPAVARAAWRRQLLGGIPTSSVKRLLKVPSDEQPTAKQTSVRLAVGERELAAEVPGRHVRAAGERLDVQRLRVLPVDPVADAAQPREVAQVLRRGGTRRGRRVSLWLVVVWARRAAMLARRWSRS